MQENSKNIAELFFENSIDLLCIADIKGYFIKLNEEWEKTLGYSLSELEGKLFIDFVHPDDVENTVKATKQLAQNTPVQNFRNRYRNKDGTYRWIEWRSRLYDNMIFATARDITNQVNMEETIKEGEKLLKGIAQNIPGMVFQFRVDSKDKYGFNFISDNSKKYLDLDNNDYDTFFDRFVNKIAPSDQQRFLDSVKKAVSDLSSWKFEGKYILSNGQEKYIKGLSKPRQMNGEVIFDGIIFDITEQKKIEDNLLRNQKLLSKSQRIAKIGTFEVQLEKNTHHWSKELFEIYGYKDLEITPSSSSFLKIIHPEDRQMIEAHIKNVINTNTFKDIVCRIVWPNGTVRYIFYSGELTLNEKGNPEILLGVAQDITDQKNTEIELKKFYDLHKTILDTVSMGIIFIKESIIQWSNNSFSKLFGYEKNEEIGKHITSFYDNPEDYNNLLSSAIKKLSEPNGVYSTEIIAKKKNGGSFYLRMTGKSINHKNSDGGSIWILKDITEEKRYEEELLKNQKLLTDSQRITRTGSWEIDLSDNSLFFNNEALHIFQIKNKKQISVETYWGMIIQEDRHIAINHFKETLQTKEFKDFEYRLKRIDGKIINILTVGEIVLDEKENPIRMFGIVQDITESKKAEEELLKSQKLLIESQKAANIGSWEYIINQDKLVWTEQTYNIYGIKDKSLEPNFKISLDLTHPDDRRSVEDKYLSSIKSNLVNEYEYRIIHPDNTIRNVRVFGKVDYKNNKPYRVYGIIQDITERKKNEQEFKKLAHLNQTILDTVNVGIAFLKNRKMVWTNNFINQTLGYNFNEIIDLDTSMLYKNKEEYAKSGEIAYTEIAKGNIYSFETEFKKKDGNLIWVYLAGKAINHKNPEEGTIWMMQDINEKKKSELALLKNQKLLTDSQRITLTGSWDIDLSSNNLFLNDEALNIYRIKDKKQISLETFWGMVIPEDKHIATNHFEETLKTKEFKDFECRVKCPDGEIITVQNAGEIVFDEKGNLVRMFGVVQDVTESKKAKEELLKTAREKEMLLKSMANAFVMWEPVLNKNNRVIDVKFLYINEAYEKVGGIKYEEVVGKRILEFWPETEHSWFDIFSEIIRTGKSKAFEMFFKPKNALYSCNAYLPWGTPDRICVVFEDITERKQYEEALKKRVLALTRPLGDIKNIQLSDLFNIEDLQKIQDTFAEATGIASLITDPDGNPITKPSNFCELCNLIRSTEKGVANCNTSDAALGSQKSDKPIIQSCLSAGLQGAGASITLGGVHIANWIIGQARDENQEKQEVLDYADKIGIDRKKYLEAYNKIPSMSKEQFKKIADALNVLTRELSIKAYQNLQQARFIAEQKEAEKQLLKAKEQAEESKQKMQRIFEFAPISIGLLRDRIILDINSQVCNLTWFKKEELIGKKTEIIFPSKKEYERVGKIMYEQLKENGFGELESKWKRKDGKHINVYLALTYLDPEDPSKGVLFTALDISKQKEVEKYLIKEKERAEESEYFLQESQRTGRIGSYKMYFKKGYWISTEILDEIFGIDNNYEKNIAGWLNIVHPDDREMMANYFQEEVINKHQPFNKEYRIIRKTNNEIRWLHGVGNLYYDNNGNLSEMLGSIQDITERKLIEEERKMMNIELEKRVKERTVQLQQANKDLESFAYSVSHDLRAPLRHIDGFVRMMYSNIPSPNKNLIGYYGKINTASSRMSSMIDELLTFSRLGRKDLKFVSIDLNSLVNEVIEQFKPDFTNRNIIWNIHQLPTIKGDKSLLRISLENIISNSIKYTSKETEAIIEIGTKQVVNDKVTFYIKDNGAGFDMSYATKLFGVFQRLHSDEEFEGIGIGLANVKQIINKHKGTITAESKINEGATFYITLPK